MERRADRDRTAVERFEDVEGNQARVLGFLRRIEEDESGDARKRR